MANASPCCRTAHSAGFGLVDVLVALTLLAIALLGACGSLHFALRGTRAAAWQSTAVDLVADLAEDLQTPDAATPANARLDAWRARLRQSLPAAEEVALQPRRLAAAGQEIEFSTLQLEWNGLPGQRNSSLQLPLAHSLAP